MKIIIIDRYYNNVLSNTYLRHPELKQAPYETQLQILMDLFFGTSNYYSQNLISLGHEAQELIINCKPLQLQWMRENLGRVKSLVLAKKLHWLLGGNREDDWQHKILFEQLKKSRPDVVHFQDPASVSPSFLASIKPYVRIITGQIASPYSPKIDFKGFDLMFSAWPHYVQRFRNQGLQSELWYLGFEPNILKRIKPAATSDVLFVGSLFRAHSNRIVFLERLAEELSFDWWGPLQDTLAPESPLRDLYRGEAWGLDMLNLLAGSKICLNYHIDEAGDWANNMRLFEATGVGTLLLTDQKKNLNELYQIGTEAIAFSSVDECIELVTHYLAHPNERKSIATSGQQATLAKHTYRQRMEQYLEYIRPYIKTNIKHTVTGNYQKLGESSSLDPACLPKSDGWLQPEVARRQQEAYKPLIADMMAGRPRVDFVTAAKAIKWAGLEKPRLLEIGCGNGYYSQVFRTLIGPEVRYTGLDYSRHMTLSAAKSYPATPFITGDAVRLPVRDNCFDIVFNGVSLMHIPDYKSALSESARAAGAFLILHTIPVCQKHRTTYLTKEAYGGRTVEIVFNWAELVEILSSLGFSILKQWDSVPYDLKKYLGESTATLTLLCAKQSDPTDAVKDDIT